MLWHLVLTVKWKPVWSLNIFSTLPYESIASAGWIGLMDGLESLGWQMLLVFVLRMMVELCFAAICWPCRPDSWDSWRPHACASTGTGHC